VSQRLPNVRRVEIDEAFEVLGLPKSATQQEIRQAFLRLSRKVHSDTGGSDRLFQHVKLAYDTLRDGQRGHSAGASYADDASADADEPLQSSAPFVEWVRTRPALALFLSGFVAVVFGLRIGNGAAMVTFIGFVATVLGLTGLLGTNVTALSAGDRTGSALLLHQMRAGAPRLLKAVGVCLLALVALLTLLGFARDRSYARRHRH
jgi:hypothetical protein